MLILLTIMEGEIKMLNFITKFFITKKESINKQLLIDDVNRRILNFRRHQALQKLKTWQQINLI